MAPNSNHSNKASQTTEGAAQESPIQNTFIPPSHDSYQEKLDARMDQWQAQLDKYKAKARETKADVSVEARSALDDATQRFDNFKHKAENFKDSGKEAWKDLAEACEESWNIFKGAAAKAKEKF